MIFHSRSHAPASLPRFRRLSRCRRQACQRVRGKCEQDIPSSYIEVMPGQQQIQRDCAKPPSQHVACRLHQRRQQRDADQYFHDSCEVHGRLGSYGRQSLGHGALVHCPVRQYVEELVGAGHDCRQSETDAKKAARSVELKIRFVHCRTPWGIAPQ